ncbi:ATP-dependent nuclease subunit B-like protein [Candidatus Sulfopaludibacter sp. SbA6]|nr:ATP-dependent nuclease subunit B-like protein [Candidatus Sulfopaludibacter sp. SbA6]
MQLLTGPAGSGKTAFVLERLREALRARHEQVRLLVPTATLAQHLQNRIAREGFVFQRALIQTLSEFVAPWAGDAPQVPDSALCLIVEDAVRRVDRPEFARVARMPGFCATLARTIAEFSAAGCDSGRLARCLPDAPLGPAFLAVYQEVDRELDRRGLAMRATRLERAAARIAIGGVEGIRTIWMDGFHALPDPELHVIGALGRHTGLTLTFDAMDASLAGMGFLEERLARSRSTPVMALVRAPGIEREVEEIARRILEQAAAGRPFREIGIIVRAQETYLPILRSTLERFGIPARFYFDEELERHAVIRFLSGAVEAMLGGWDHARTLGVLRLAPRFADSNTMDRFAFGVREQVPNNGLGALKAILGDNDRLHKLIDDLGAIEEWRAFALGPKDWAARLRTLRNLFRPAVGQSAPVQALRSQAAALDLFDEALAEAAAALDPGRRIGLEEFWPAVKSVFRLKPLRLEDGRRNVVHVLSAPEARQWVLPVVFVCGMVEKQFPQFHRQDPFFPDGARCRLNAAGIRVRTAAEWEREERALFESAVTRATLLVTLSYPEFDRRGDRNLRSLYLEDLALSTEVSRTVCPQPRSQPTPPRPLEIRAPALLDYLRHKTARLSPTQLEMYLQCPFQYFAGRVLRLKTAPPRPEDRLDFLTQGNIVHEVLATWWANPQDLDALFELVFARHCEEKRVPRGYHAERLRNTMLDDLRAFAADARWPRAGFQSRTEEKFVFPMAEGLDIAGRIDRLDVAPDGRAYVIDYKYSRAQRVKDRHSDDTLLQAPLYMMAAERVLGVKPVGMYYVGLKRGIVYAGWSETQVADLPHVALPATWRERAEERTLRVVEEVRAGRVEVAPADADNCRFCDYRDVCRVQLRQAAEEEAEGAS